MQTNSIILQNLSSDQLTELMTNVFKTQLEDFKKEFRTKSTQPQTEDLMTRKEVLELLKINASTLHHWQNAKKIKVYKYANKCYYKRSELMNDLTLLKK